MAYCEDCKKEVDVNVVRDAIGDADSPYGLYEFDVWKCRECGGENLLAEAPEEDKQAADLN